MTTSISVERRAADARVEIARTRAELSAWLSRRRKSDTLQQFATQLSSLEGVLMKALAGVEAALPAAAAPWRDGLDQCRRVERGAVWLRRVWSFFRWRFDQRDDTRLKRLLAAADEVVWSCYVEPFLITNSSMPSSPLAYVEDRYSPFAVPRKDPPHDLRFDVDAAFLAGFLPTLPIPILGLPPVTVEHPWWLVFAAHEIGHHVQFDLVQNAALVETFPAQLGGAVVGVHGASAAKRWARWSLEIFADAWSVLTVGPAALWALVDFEAGSDARLMRTHLQYPCPLLRFALMQGLLERLGVPASDALRGFDPSSAAAGPAVMVDGVDIRAALAADLAIVPTIVNLMASHVVAHGRSLPELARWSAMNFVAFGEVDTWRTAFASAAGPQPIETIDAARLAAGGGLWAWADLQQLPLNDPERARAELRDRVLDCVARSREPSVRTAVAPGTFASDDAGDQLSTLVLERAPDLGPLFGSL